MKFYRIVFMLLIMFYSTSILATTDVSVIPFEIKNGLPIVHINLQGQDFPLMLDLGSTDIYLQLSPDVRKRLHIDKLTGKTKSQYFNSCGISQHYDTYMLREVTMGQFKMNHVTAYEYKLMPGCSDFADNNPSSIFIGIVGLNLLKEFNFIVDYHHKKLVLYRHSIPLPYSALPWKWTNMRSDIRHGIMTDAVIANKKLTLLWDTGSTISTLKESACNKADKCKRHKNKMIGNVTLVPYNIGSAYFHILSNDSIPFDGSIGGSFFADHVVNVDVKRHRVGWS